MGPNQFFGVKNMEKIVNVLENFGNMEKNRKLKILGNMENMENGKMDTFGKMEKSKVETWKHGKKMKTWKIENWKNRQFLKNEKNESMKEWIEKWLSEDYGHNK